MIDWARSSGVKWVAAYCVTRQQSKTVMWDKLKKTLKRKPKDPRHVPQDPQFCDLIQIRRNQRFECVDVSQLGLDCGDIPIKHVSYDTTTTARLTQSHNADVITWDCST
jgi:hypothetical protein